jgi:O-acetyl-ADP-ribose deacetylase (regulator of RNase III)
MELTMALEKTLGRTAVSLIIGDITEIEVDAFVFYARPDLKLGTGFGTAISTRGGPKIQEELDELAPVATGQAVVTGAGKLKAKSIVHAVGPRFQEEGMAGKLRETVLSSLKAAEEKDVKTLALPAMGAGFYGVPLADCARVMVDTLKTYLQGRTGLERAIICVLDAREYAPFESEFGKI